MRFSIYDVAILVLLTIGQVICYPSYLQHQQRKADPFVALANTLRQEQEQEALQQQQPQQQQRLDNGYYYDYGPSDDDLYQMAQFQRQLSRAAVAPFFGRTQRNSWGNVVLDDAEYGYPVETEGSLSEQQEAPLSEWYDSAVDQEEMAKEQREQEEEGQLLLDMLTEYMLLYGGAGQPDAAEESKRTATEDSKRTAADSLEKSPENKTEAKLEEAKATTSTITPDVQQQQRRKEKQPPVRKSQDGTPLGQEEFPMMRPATPQRNQWLMATQMLQNSNGNNKNFQSADLDSTNKKRHYKGKNLDKMSSIVTSPDELIEELDNLKMKKN